MYDLFKSYALYNAKTNDELYKIIAGMSSEQLGKEVNAFYPSVIETIKHINKTNFRWLARIEGISGQKIVTEKVTLLSGMSDVLSADSANLKDELHAIKSVIDQKIMEAIESLKKFDFDLEVELPMGERQVTKKLWQFLLQWFNHMTHHRGQISVLLDMLSIENDYSSMMNKI